MNIELDRMACLHPKHTELCSMIYSTYNGANIEKHCMPKIKLETSNRLITLIIGTSVICKERFKVSTFKQYKIRDAIKYVVRHKGLFTKHWNGEITDYELHQQLYGDDIR